MKTKNIKKQAILGKGKNNFFKLFLLNNQYPPDLTQRRKLFIQILNNLLLFSSNVNQYDFICPDCSCN